MIKKVFFILNFFIIILVFFLSFDFVLSKNTNLFKIRKDCFNYNKIDLSLLKKLDRNIKIINLGPMLKSIDDQIGDKKIFHKFDGHYNKNGYEIVSKLINMEIKKILKK